VLPVLIPKDSELPETSERRKKLQPFGRSQNIPEKYWKAAAEAAAAKEKEDQKKAAEAAAAAAAAKKEDDFTAFKGKARALAGSP
jgi:hypothetical protein